MAKSKGRRSLLLFFVMVVLLIGYATNPTEEKFRDYFQEEINKAAENEDNIVSESLLKIFSGAISNLTPISHKNYYIFTIYKIDVSDEDYVFLGAFNHFYELPK